MAAADPLVGKNWKNTACVPNGINTNGYEKNEFVAEGKPRGQRGIGLRVVLKPLQKESSSPEKKIQVQKPRGGRERAPQKSDSFKCRGTLFGWSGSQKTKGEKPITRPRTINCKIKAGILKWNEKIRSPARTDKPSTNPPLEGPGERRKMRPRT